MNWEIETKKIDFIRPWKISGANVVSKDIYLVKFSVGDYFGYGEISYGSKENVSLDSLKADLESFSYEYRDTRVAQFSDLTRLLDKCSFEEPRIRFAIESAFIDYLAAATEISPWKILGTNTVKSVDSVHSLPLFDSIEEGNELITEVHDNAICKLKISKETFPAQLEFIKSSNRPFILDANESWGKDINGILEVISQLDEKQILFIEQPLDKFAINEYRELKKQTKINIFLDETVQDHRHLETFTDLCHGIVLKSSKSCSLMRLVSQMSAAKKLGLKTMLGCMVESTVGIASLFNVAYGFDYYDFDGFTKLNPDGIGRVFWDQGKVCLSSMN